MDKTERRAIKVEHRVAALRRKHERRVISLLAVSSFILIFGLISILPAIGGGVGYVPGLYGSTLLSEDAGGYVMTGILAFSAAVVITVLCIRHSDRKRQENNQNINDKE